MDPEKLAAIVVVSAEVVRADPGGYMSGLEEDLAEAFANAFDAAALHGTSSPFSDALGDTTKTVELGTATTMYEDLVAGLSALVADGKKLNGFAFGLEAEPLFLGETDTTNRPLFIDAPPSDTFVDGQQRGRIIGRPALLDEAVTSGTTRGFGGDWSKAAWGVVGGISYDISTEATVTINSALVSLFENNLVAIRAEAEYGFVVEDVEHWVEFLDAA
jgi:HK97 family phage major capsid protein